MHDAEALGDVVLGLRCARVRPLAVLGIHLAANAVQVEAPGVSRLGRHVRGGVDERTEGNGDLGDKAGVLIALVIEGAVDLRGRRQLRRVGPGRLRELEAVEDGAEDVDLEVVVVTDVGSRSCPSRTRAGAGAARTWHPRLFVHVRMRASASLLGFDSVNVGRVDSLSAGLRKAPATSKRMAGANGPKYDVSLVKYFFIHSRRYSLR